jgi:predicted alpha/beta superfamily hydrolase
MSTDRAKTPTHTATVPDRAAHDRRTRERRNQDRDDADRRVRDVGDHTLTGTFRLHKRFRSRFLEHDRRVIVYLPPNYEESRRRGTRYPVLYLHDGQNLFDRATAFGGEEWRVDETAQSLIEQRAIEPLIIVGVYNSGDHRIREYTPTPDPHVDAGGGADYYGRMLVEELKPLIDRRYRTLPGAASTGLGGSSLGGLVTMYLGLKYPTVFSRLAMISPAVWWDRRVIVQRVEELEGKLPLRIWLECGTAEGKSVCTNARLLRDALVAKGWAVDDDLAYAEVEGGEHNERSWAARVDPMLRFLFPARR